MKDFLRPEVQQALKRWHEALIGAAVALFGLWMVTGGIGITVWVGAAVIIGGLAFGLTGIQRGRFRQAGQGAGVVQIVEGQVSYFGPFTGGSIPISDLDLIELTPGSGDAAFWVLSALGHDTLRIPANAKGSDALFDVFAALPGIQTERMLRELMARPTQTVVIWQKPSCALH